jgi:hypothetical protein
MTQTLGAELGPLAPLAGVWEGDQGVDVAFGNVEGAIIETPFRERTTFSPFGPVENGAQVLYGLDYRMAGWRPGEELPFHTEVGYWLWDAANGQVMKCFVVPRGIAVLALGEAAPQDRTFVMRAHSGSSTDGISSNRFLEEAARTTDFEAVITVAEDGSSFSYEETSLIDHRRMPDVVRHTDRNTLHRVAE